LELESNPVVLTEKRTFKCLLVDKINSIPLGKDINYLLQGGFFSLITRK